MMEPNACILLAKGKSTSSSNGILLNVVATVTFDISSTRTTSSNSSPNTSLEIPSEELRLFPDVA
jgi:hypothetical protein